MRPKVLLLSALSLLSYPTSILSGVPNNNPNSISHRNEYPRYQYDDIYDDHDNDEALRLNKDIELVHITIDLSSFFSLSRWGNHATNYLARIISLHFISR